MPTAALVSDTLPRLDELRDKLLKARCRLMTREPWYGHIAMSMVWKPTDFRWQDVEASKTMGVRIIRGGVVECLWYPGFVHRQNIKQLYATIYHEIDHIVRLHCLRIGTDREHEAWNVAADMTINGKRSHPRIGYVEPQSFRRTLPLDGNIVWVPETWDDGLTTEVYYNRLIMEGPKMPCPECLAKAKAAGQSDGDGNDGNGGGPGKSPDKGNKSGAGVPSSTGVPDPGKCPQCGGRCGGGLPGQYAWAGVHGEQLDDHSTWQQSEVSQDEARQIVRDIVNRATTNNMGNAPGHLTEALKELNKPIVRWRELLKRYIGRHVGSQRLTFSRRNRRNDVFGIKGISRHAASRVRVIVDTSGSISTKELQQFFAEIDAMTSYAEVKVLLWDHTFQGYDKYRRGDWKHWKVNGRGGTDMAAPVRWLEDHRQLGDCQILLTDGVCNWAESRAWYPELGMISVITRSESTPPDWGHVVRMRLE